MSGRESVRLFLALIRMKDENLGGGGERDQLERKKNNKDWTGLFGNFCSRFLGFVTINELL